LIGAACLSAACAAAAERHDSASGEGCACTAALCDAGHAEEGGGSGKARMGLLFFVFVLAIFLGVELISKVPSQLHTPLMSGSNAISGISVVGALVAAGTGKGPAMILLGTLAVALAMVNVVGGYLVTDRMLGMFKHKD
jgi:NAD(P) transhydrogenase subunit alpha